MKDSIETITEEAPSSNQGTEKKIDPFCVEKNLRSWASSRIIARGRDYYRKGCVLSLESNDEGHISASVEGTLDTPYQVHIRFDPCGLPVSKCTCPFTFEPLCKHAVAVLIAWQQAETGSEPTLGPLPAGEVLGNSQAQRDEYLEERARLEREDRRARSQEQGLRIRIKPIGGLLGAYNVLSANPDRKGESYRVVIRDALFAHASCDCTDYRTNELGTCKHIEVVKHFLGAKARAAELPKEEAKTRWISVYLRSRETHRQLFHALEEIRVYVSPNLRGKADTVLAGEVDHEGYFRNGRDPIRQRQRFERLLKSLGEALGNGVTVEIDPLVAARFREEEESFRWEKRLDEVAQTPSKHPAWQRSIGTMGIELHPYQLDGILFAVKKRKAFIGDDMGLGKTMQAIGAALLLKELGQVKRVVIICPASLKFQWRQEIQKVSQASVAIIAGSARQRAEQYRKAGEFFLILNYELLYRDLGNVRALNPDLVILDEAQRIKNWETKIHQTLKRLQSPYRLVLTGTPLENRLAELHGITEFLNPRALGASWKLLPTYATLDANDKVAGYTNLDHLRERLKQFLIRRTRAEVLTQLPKRTENNYWTPLLPEQKDVHDEYAYKVTILINKWKRYKRLTKEDMQRLFMYLTCMRIVCNSHGQYVWKEIEQQVLTARCLTPHLKKKIGSPKLDEFYKVMSELLEDPAQKIVVFSQWERMIRLAELSVRDILEAGGSRSVIFSGSLSMKKREAEIKRFLEDAKTRVFFSTDAGGVGLNLQHAANVVVNLEIPWNPAVMEQRIGRVYRMGQKKSVQAINLISSECIEQRIYQLVGQKKALFTGLFDGTNQEIHFEPKQTASFLEKVQQIVPADEKPLDSAADGDEPGKEDLGLSEEIVIDAVNSHAPSPTRGGDDAGANAPPTQEIDLTSLISGLAGLFKAPASMAGGRSPDAEAAPPAKLAVKMSQDQNGVHLSIPQPAVEVLKGFRPLLEMLLKLSQ